MWGAGCFVQVFLFVALHCVRNTSCLLGSTKRWSPGIVKFDTAVAYHFLSTCLEHSRNLGRAILPGSVCAVCTVFNATKRTGSSTHSTKWQNQKACFSVAVAKRETKFSDRSDRRISPLDLSSSSLPMYYTVVGGCNVRSP